MLVTNDIKKAAELLKNGELVAFATETVYGLGGNAMLDAAVASIYHIKGRPHFNPLIVHVLSLQQAKLYVTVNAKAEALARHFWPGPLTMVLPRNHSCGLSLLSSAGLDTVAVRAPSHPVARALLSEIDFPLVAPSANRSGKISPTQASHVREEFGDTLPLVLDGGACVEGIESTVIDLTTSVPVILRAGSITKEQLEAVIGRVEFHQENGRISSPGMLEKHYAPDAELRINAHAVSADEALLAFGPPITGAITTLNLSPTKNLKEAAANLFCMLRQLDAMHVKAIAVMPIPEEGLGIAINDRLRRAAKR